MAPPRISWISKIGRIEQWVQLGETGVWWPWRRDKIPLRVSTWIDIDFGQHIEAAVHADVQTPSPDAPNIRNLGPGLK